MGSFDPRRDARRTEDVCPSNGRLTRRARIHIGAAEAEEGSMKTVLIYVSTSAEVGDVDHLKVSANETAAEWFAENYPDDRGW